MQYEVCWYGIRRISASLDKKRPVRILGACIALPINARPVTQYIITRQDLPKGFLAAQVAHAAGSYGKHPDGAYVVVLGVRDEKALEALAAKLWDSGVEHVQVREPDAPWCGQLTSIGCALVEDRSSVRKVVSGIPLLR
jgi:hypothetical protein